MKGTRGSAVHYLMSEANGGLNGRQTRGFKSSGLAYTDNMR